MRYLAAKILCRPRELREELTLLLTRRESLSAACQKMTSSYDIIRVKTGSGSSDGALTALADMDEQIKEHLRKIADAEKAAEILLNRFAETPERTARRNAELLRLRYLRCLPWREIEREMNTRGYFVGTVRTLNNWNKAAMRRLELFAQYDK